jgi:hypothetical protein
VDNCPKGATKQMEKMADELEKSKEEARRAQSDMERLLDVMQATQEEQNAKENTIRELQE